MDQQLEMNLKENLEENTSNISLRKTDAMPPDLEDDHAPMIALSPNLVKAEELTTKSTKETVRRSVRLFVANAGLVVLFHAFMVVYNNAIIRTLERRFGLTSAQTGLILSCNDIMHLCIVLFIGYFGRTGHKPRIICATVMFSAAAGFMMASPHFLLSSSSADDQHQTQEKVVSNASNFKPFTLSYPFCLNTGENGTAGDRCDDIGSTASHRNSLLLGTHPAYYVFLTAQLISGIGGSGMHTLGLAYIDENVRQSKSPLYVGVLTGLYSFGTIGGVLLAAMTLRLPENLFNPVTSDPFDPTWIGCWWLGYLICAVALLVSGIPLWFYPKSYKDVPSAKNTEAKKLQEELSVKNVAKTVKRDVIEFPRRLLHLLRNRPFVVNMFSEVCAAYIIVGVYANLVRYIEIHFLERAFVGSLIAGLVSALAWAAGGFLGGLLVSRLKLRPVGSMKIVLLSDACFASGLVIVMFLGCPQLQMAGRVDPTENKFTVITDCNQQCACSEMQKAYSPVCGGDNLTYFSACMAGCKNFSNGASRMYSGCSCIGSSTGTLYSVAGNGGIEADGFARPGLCRPPCNLLVPFAVTLFLMSLVGAMARVPSTIVNFRVVGDDERSFALSINSFADNLLGFVPAPLLFGALIDWTCKLWQTTTCKKTGSCLLYNTDRFRYVTYGVAILFKGIDFVLAIVLFLFVRKMVFPTPEEKATEMEIKNCGKEQDRESLQVIESVI